jgi:omega-amidase
MQDLIITLVQSNPAWQKVDINLPYYETLLNEKDLETDLIVLPEMFSTGFTMHSAAMAEPMEGKTHNWMREQASKLDAVVCGSVIIKENNNYYNRLLWVEADGNTRFYDKKHLFRMANENEFYSAGNKHLTVQFKGWKIRPLVCYDLRFPVWSRNRVSNNEFDYDILLYVANWPQARVAAWDTLLKARAMENNAYTIGVNRVGKDEKEINYNGHSAIYNPKGEEVGWAGEKEGILTTKVEKLPLDNFRAKFPSYLDADNFDIH